MAANESDLLASLADLKQNVSAAAQRVSDKLASLTPQSPNFDAEVADIQADIAALKAIAPADASSPTPAAPSAA